MVMGFELPAEVKAELMRGWFMGRPAANRAMAQFHAARKSGAA